MGEQPGYYDPLAETHRHHGASLPHWNQAGATYYVTFRLADSLPAAVLDAWRRERADLLADALLDESARQRQVRRLHAERVEAHLDRGVGECLLARPACADLVATALRHFDGQRYRLWAWCVMPNHVHALCEPLAEQTLPALLHSWKSFTAGGLNKLLGREGAVWQKESFDHLVRREPAMRHFRHYILSNPEQAGLRDWRWRGALPWPGP